MNDPSISWAIAGQGGCEGECSQQGTHRCAEQMLLRHASDHPPKLLEQQPENGLALAQGPAQALGVFVEDGAGGASLEAAPGSVK